MDFPLLLQRLKNDNYLIQTKNQRICEFDDNSQLIVSKKVLETSEMISNMLAGALQRTRKIPFPKTSIEDFKIILPLMKLAAYSSAPDFKSFCDNKDLNYLTEALHINSYFAINKVENNLIQIIAEKCDALLSQNENQQVLQKIKNTIKNETLFEQIVSLIIPTLKEISEPKIEGASEVKKYNKLDNIVEIITNNNNCTIRLCSSKKIIYVDNNYRFGECWHIENAFIDPQKKFLFFLKPTTFENAYSGIFINLNEFENNNALQNIPIKNIRYKYWFNVNGTRLVVCKFFGKYQLIDTATKRVIKEFSYANNKKQEVVFSHDEKLFTVLTNNDTGTYEIRSVETGELKRTFSFDKPIDTISFLNANTLFAYIGHRSSDYPLLIVNYIIKIINILEIQSSIKTFENIKKYIFNKEKTVLAFVSNDKKLIIYTFKEKNYEYEEVILPQTINLINLEMQNNNFLIKGNEVNSNFSKFYLYNLEEKQLKYLFSVDRLDSFKWNNDRNLIVYSYKNNDQFNYTLKVNFFDINNSQTINIAENVDGRWDPRFYIKDHIIEIPFNNGKCLMIYDMFTQKEQGQYVVRKRIDWYRDISKDNKLVLAVTGTNEISLVHIKTNRIIESWNNNETKAFLNQPPHVESSPDVIYLRGKDKSVRYFEIEYTLKSNNLDKKINYYKFDPNCDFVDETFSK
jgi:hypothetical protein